MTPDQLRELLPLYALGVLDDDEARAVEQAVAADPSLAVEVAAYRDAATELVAPVAPPAEVETRLMASIGHGRYEPYSARIGTLFDVSVEAARELLGLTDRPASWEPQAVPGIFLVHFDGGPAYAAADCGFIRLADGAVFPHHTHLGEEVSVVLSGQMRARDGDGERVLVAGDQLIMPAGSSHQLEAVDGECIYAARAMNGIEIGGAPMRPPKPER